MNIQEKELEILQSKIKYLENEVKLKDELCNLQKETIIELNKDIIKYRTEREELYNRLTQVPDDVQENLVAITNEIFYKLKQNLVGNVYLSIRDKHLVTTIDNFINHFNLIYSTKKEDIKFLIDSLEKVDKEKLSNKHWTFVIRDIIVEYYKLKEYKTKLNIKK